MAKATVARPYSKSKNMFMAMRGHTVVAAAMPPID